MFGTMSITPQVVDGAIEALRFLQSLQLPANVEGLLKKLKDDTATNEAARLQLDYDTSAMHSLKQQLGFRESKVVNEEKVLFEAQARYEQTRVDDKAKLDAWKQDVLSQRDAFDKKMAGIKSFLKS